MNILGVSNQVYRPCYKLNDSTGKVESGSYNYSALMENIQKQAAVAKEKMPEIGNKELSEAEIQELAEQFDPKDMTQDEYDKFIQYLQEKGVLSRIETNDLGMSRCTITPGYFEPVYISSTLFGKDMLVGTLSDVGGNAIRYAELMTQWEAPGDLQIKQNAFYKVLGILNEMNTVRSKTEV